MLLTNRSRIQHFTCDVTMTSFYMGLKPNFNTTFTIYAGMCMPRFALLILRVAKILRGRKWVKNMPPQRLAGGAKAQRPLGQTAVKYVVEPPKGFKRCLARLAAVIGFAVSLGGSNYAPSCQEMTPIESYIHF